MPSRPLAMQTLEEEEEHDDHHHGMKQIRMAVITPVNNNGAEAGAPDPEQEQSEQWSQPLSFSDDLEKQEENLGVDIKYGHERFDSTDDPMNGAAVKNYHVTPLHVATIHTQAPPAMESVASSSPRDDQILKQL